LPHPGKPPAAPNFPFTQQKARRYQRDYARWAGLPVEATTAEGIVLVLVPPGTFRMGSPKDEADRLNDEDQWTVTLSRPFYLSKYETTVGQFRRFVKATGHRSDGEKRGGGNAHDVLAVWKHKPGVSWRKPGFSGPFALRDDHPVVHVSFNDITAFGRWLQTAAGVTVNQVCYALPTEAQWEWACRAGSGTRFWWGDEEDTTGKRLNACDRALKRMHRAWPRKIMPMDDGHAFPAPVGSYQSNAWGLHDMLGNVWEFCSTHYGPYPRKPTRDPGHLDLKRGFTVRGGGWSNEAKDCRCATRQADPPWFCHSNLGFRIALQLPSP
jgi:formylglycine-generating enzyme required for sulfatase activity